jgi:hypothetical protein
MTSDQQWYNATAASTKAQSGQQWPSATATLPKAVVANWTGPLDWRIVLRRNRFHGGGGIGIGSAWDAASPKHAAQTTSSVLVEENVLEDGACNVTVRPMPAGASINEYLKCAPACAVEGVAFVENSLAGAQACP